MSIEKRKYSRYYFAKEKIPEITLAAESYQFPAELLNISAGGLCLSINSDRQLSSEQLEKLNIKSLNLEEQIELKAIDLKLCYFYRARDLQKIICGVEFISLPAELRQKLQQFVQKKAIAEVSPHS